MDTGGPSRPEGECPAVAPQELSGGRRSSNASPPQESGIAETPTLVGRFECVKWGARHEGEGRANMHDILSRYGSPSRSRRIRPPADRGRTQGAGTPAFVVVNPSRCGRLPPGLRGVPNGRRSVTAGELNTGTGGDVEGAAEPAASGTCSLIRLRAWRTTSTIDGPSLPRNMTVSAPSTMSFL